MKKTAITISVLLITFITYGQVTMIFEDNFETGNFNSNWTLQQNLDGIDGVVEIEDGSGINNSKGVEIGKLNDNTGFTTNALDLHLDLTGQVNVEMTFWINDRRDETDNDDGIYFSDNGGTTFTKVLDFHPDEWCDLTYGEHPPLDIDKLANAEGLNPTSNQFVIRFQQRGEDDFSGSSAASTDGFYLDEVKVYNPNLTYSTLPFEDDFNNGVFNNSWAHSFADQTSTVVSNFEITSPMSKIAIENGSGVDNSYGVEIGRRCDGAFTTNALDLHLDLTDQDNVVMTFWINDRRDETDNDDGIYFSDNGGTTFTKVLDFDFSTTIDNTFIENSINISNLLSSNFMETSSNSFILRFQQRGEDDFSGSSAASTDGFYLDDISITSTPTSIQGYSGTANFNIYPNPCSNTLYVESKLLNNRIIEIKFSDILGREVKSDDSSFESGLVSLDISSLSQGLIFVSIHLQSGEVIVEKIIKE